MIYTSFSIMPPPSIVRQNLMGQGHPES